MRKFIPTLSETFPKPKHGGRKPGQQSRDRKRLTPDVIVERVSAATSPKHAPSDDLLEPVVSNSSRHQCDS